MQIVLIYCICIYLFPMMFFITYRHVFSINAPYVKENPISLSQIRAVHVYKFGFGYITMFCESSLHKLEEEKKK